MVDKCLDCREDRARGPCQCEREAMLEAEWAEHFDDEPTEEDLDDFARWYYELMGIPYPEGVVM